MSGPTNSPTNHASNDDFYVGYLATAPTGLTSWIRPRIVVLLLIILVVPVLLVAAQRPFSAAVFEFGQERTFSGTLRHLPYPVLEVARPSTAGPTSNDVPLTSRYLLVGFGKLGLDRGATAFDGQRVTLAGTLIYRDSRTMIEVVDGTLALAPNDGTDPSTVRLGQPPEALGSHTLRGEIVDSKCFLGVMKPGNLKPHRACATRCISGGVPPVFLVRDTEGNGTYLLLTAADGSSVNTRVLDRIAEPLEITGDVERHGDLLILRADPATYRRLTPR